MVTQCEIGVRNEALLEIRPLIVYIAQRQDEDRLRRCGMTFDDLIQEAAVIFLRKYDPARGTPRSFASTCVYTALYLGLRKHAASERKHQRYAKKLAQDDARNSVPVRPTFEPEVADQLHAALATLSPAMRQLLADRFGLGEQQPKTLQRLSGGLVTKEAIRQRVVICLNRVRIAMSSNRNKKGRA